MFHKGVCVGWGWREGQDPLYSDSHDSLSYSLFTKLDFCDFSPFSVVGVCLPACNQKLFPDRMADISRNLSPPFSPVILNLL